MVVVVTTVLVSVVPFDLCSSDVQNDTLLIERRSRIWIACRTLQSSLSSISRRLTSFYSDPAATTNVAFNAHRAILSSTGGLIAVFEAYRPVRGIWDLDLTISCRQELTS